MNEWLIKHKSDDLWLTPYGLSYAKNSAMRFKFRDDAEAYAKGRLPADTWIAEPFKSDDERYPNIQTDYNPHGFPNA